MNLGPACLLAAVVAAPCIWDRDTLGDELRGIPDAHDLVTGRWYRHTTEYYEQRIAKLGGRADLTLSELDDLAVAWERLGDRARAIEVMDAKRAALEATPDEEHLYRYHANLGTFYAHDGQFDRALVELERAVELNPDAHFGRERYQIELIRYVAAAREDPRIWAAADFIMWGGGWMDRWIAYPAAITDAEIEYPAARPLAGFDTAEAIEAVAGMLRFGGLEGPELYRALGDLYLSEQNLNLAWFAWKRALEKEHPGWVAIEAAVDRVEEHWRGDSLGTSRPLLQTDEDYREQRALADAWLAAFQAAEVRALASGLDPGEPVVLERLVAEADELVPRPEHRVTRSLLAVTWPFLLVLVLGPLLLNDARKRRATARRLRYVGGSPPSEEARRESA